MTPLRPRKLIICGHAYAVEYHKSASDTSHDGQSVQHGQVDLMNRTIRVYVGGCRGNIANVVEVLLHEIIEAIVFELEIEELGGDDKHRAISSLSTMLADTLVRNRMVQI